MASAGGLRSYLDGLQEAPGEHLRMGDQFSFQVRVLQASSIPPQYFHVFCQFRSAVSPSVLLAWPNSGASRARWVLYHETKTSSSFLHHREEVFSTESVETTADGQLSFQHVQKVGGVLVALPPGRTSLSVVCL